jgi:5-methylcytosine-specific restriction endonuclease McrA
MQNRRSSGGRHQRRAEYLKEETGKRSWASIVQGSDQFLCSHCNHPFDPDEVATAHHFAAALHRYGSRCRRTRVGDARTHARCMRPMATAHPEHSRQQVGPRVGAANNASDATRVRRRAGRSCGSMTSAGKSGRRKVRDAYGSRPMCVYCGSGAGTADHVVPRAKGGGHGWATWYQRVGRATSGSAMMSPAEFFRRYPKAAQAIRGARRARGPGAARGRVGRRQ